MTEKVPVSCAHYAPVYDNLVDAIENGADKVEAATEVAKSWNK